MNQSVIGKFIAECRKEKSMTQAQLAEQLGITDRAVSKWETGKCMPDASIMLELCEILEITVNELLSGEKLAVEFCEKRADENLIALKKREESRLPGSAMISVCLTAVLLTGIIVCAICDAAVFGRLTWSLIVISSILFAWLISIPAISLGKRGIIGSLVSLSVFVLPYLYVLSRLTGVRAVLSIGAIMSVYSVVYLWSLAAIFKRLRERKAVAAGVAFLLAVPFMIVVNMTLSGILSEPLFDIWDAISVFLLLLLSLPCFACDYARKKSR